MKLLLLGMFISASTYAGFDKSCIQFQKDNLVALKITKTFNQDNELVVRLAVDKTSCSFKTNENPLTVYWEMGKKASKGIIPCEKVLVNEARDFFGYNDIADMYARAIISNSSYSLTVDMPALSSFPKRLGSKQTISEHVNFTIQKTKKGCEIITKLEVNSRTKKVTKIHNIIKFLSFKRIEFYKQNQLVHKI